jgi:hypothetical protein
MQRSTSGEADDFSANQEIHHAFLTLGVSLSRETEFLTVMIVKTIILLEEPQ